jgi:zinc-binding alcohol dehydrogenase/oxidoreductase
MELDHSYEIGMKAVVFLGKDKPLTVKEFPKPIIQGKDVLVRLRAAALNHRDIWIKSEQSVTAPNGIILGSDGSGVVEDVGEEVDVDLMDKKVIINPGLAWGKNPAVQADSFRILGFPDHGTFAEYIAISKDHVVESPEHLSWEESAALPLSGLTAYRALFTKARVRPGEKILITGIGGGTAQMAMKFAIAFQCRVYVTSGSEEKLDKAKALGATGGFNHHDNSWSEKALKDSGPFDVIVDGAAGNQFGKFVELAIPGGRIINYGRTAGDITQIIPRALYWKQLSILGTTMGTRDEFLSMVDFVHKHRLRPEISGTYYLDHVTEAFHHLETGEQFGKIVLKIKD